MPKNPALPERQELKELIATPDLPELGPGPRASVLGLAAVTMKLDEFVRHAPMASAAQQRLSAAVLLSHNHLDAAHQIAQNLAGADGSFLHVLLHLPQPCYS